MKRLAVFAVVLLLALSLLSACGSSADEREPETEEVKTAYLYLDVSFESNLLLNKYDVFIELNGDRLGEIKHGDYFTHLAEVPLGECKIEFINTEKSSVTASKDLTIESDTTYRCTIHTDSDEIVIKEEEVTDGIEGSRLLMPDVVGANLEKATEELETIGFVNIESRANDDRSILMASNWVVIEQNVDAGTELDKNQKIVLSCRKETELFNEAYKELNLADAKKKASDEGFTIFELKEDSAFTNVTKRLEKISDEDAAKWIVTDADKVSDTEARFYLSYTGDVKVPDVVGMTVKEAKKALRKQYAFNIETEDADDFIVLDDETWMVTKQSIDAGKVIKYSDKITLICKESGNDQAEKPKETTTEEFSKDGNKGIYAYKDKGGAYSNYYIIDFDEGYVYYFTDESGNESGEKYKIGSGDLNEGLKIAYKNDDNAWIYAMHFHYKNNPSKLIIVDYQYNEWEFNKTFVDDAKKLMKSKTLTEY